MPPRHECAAPDHAGHAGLALRQHAMICAAANAAAVPDALQCIQSNGIHPVNHRRQTRQSSGTVEHLGHDQENLLDVIKQQPEEPEWQALLQYLMAQARWSRSSAMQVAAQSDCKRWTCACVIVCMQGWVRLRYRVDPSLGEPARRRAVVKQLCGLLTAADARLAAAAASATASFYGPEQSYIDKESVLSEHIADIGALLSNPAAVAQVTATGPPLAVGRLTIAAAWPDAGAHLGLQGRTPTVSQLLLLQLGSGMCYGAQPFPTILLSVRTDMMVTPADI
jgi:hypothetical protein